MPPRAILARPAEPTETAGMLSVDVLLSHVADAQPEAFAKLYDRMAPAVYAIAKRVLCNEAMAEEVMHEAMIDVWSTCRSFDRARGSASTWILTIAHRRAVDVVRRERAANDRIARSAARSWERPYDVVSETVLRSLGDARVREALQLLTPLQRHAVQLAYYGGRTQREVAEMLEVPLGTAKSRISDGLRRLQKELAGAR